MTLADVKLSLGVKTNAYDDEITSLIQSALVDLEIAGVEFANVDDIVATAVKSYVKLHFRTLADSEYRHLKASYDEQKAQLSMATGYTDWGGIDE